MVANTVSLHWWRGSKVVKCVSLILLLSLWNNCALVATTTVELTYSLLLLLSLTNLKNKFIDNFFLIIITTTNKDNIIRLVVGRSIQIGNKSLVVGMCCLISWWYDDMKNYDDAMNSEWALSKMTKDRCVPDNNNKSLTFSDYLVCMYVCSSGELLLLLYYSRLATSLMNDCLHRYLMHKLQVKATHIDQPFCSLHANK